MASQRIASMLLLAARIALVSASTTYEGYGTVYTLSSPSDGNCNFMNWPKDAETKYAALNAEQWEETMNCGRCAQVSCTDASCAGQSSEIVYIMDQCPGCEYGDLDLSPDVFESITGQSYTKLSIEWQFVDCPIQNNVQYCLKTGSSEFWVAVQPANFVSGVQSLSIDGQEASVIDSAYYFLIDGSGNSVADLSSISISLTGVSGEILEETLSLTADECTEGSSQFSTSGGYSQTTTTTKTSTATSAPTTAAPTGTPPPTTTAPATTPIPTMAAPTSAPVTGSPVTEAPATTVPPVTAIAPSTAPVTEAPTPTEIPKPTSAAPIATPTQTPAPTATSIALVQSASTSSNSSRGSSTSVDHDSSIEMKSTKVVTGSSVTSTSSTTDQESESASISSEKATISLPTQVSSSTQTSPTVQTTSAPTPTSTPSATVASVQEEASSSGGLHSTAAIVGLVAAVCVALGAAVGVAMVVHKKRKLLEEQKNAGDRDSMASYASVRTPRSEVPVMHSAV